MGLGKGTRRGAGRGSGRGSGEDQDGGQEVDQYNSISRYPVIQPDIRYNPSPVCILYSVYYYIICLGNIDVRGPRCYGFRQRLIYQYTG